MCTCPIQFVLLALPNILFHLEQNFFCNAKKRRTIFGNKSAKGKNFYLKITDHDCNTVYLKLMRHQCEALKNNVKCLLDPINILNSSSSYFVRSFKISVHNTVLLLMLLILFSKFTLGKNIPESVFLRMFNTISNVWVKSCL
jgi:hypothetical protein